MTRASPRIFQSPSPTPSNGSLARSAAVRPSAAAVRGSGLSWVPDGANITVSSDPSDDFGEGERVEIDPDFTT